MATVGFDHQRAVAASFHGTVAERLVLLAYALHADPKSGCSTLSVRGCAAFTHLQRSHVLRIIRGLEGTPAATQPEPGKWLYPVGDRQSRPGDGLATYYRMFLDAFTPIPAKGKARNPLGLNQGKRQDGGSRNPPHTGVPGTQGQWGVPGTPPGVPYNANGGSTNLKTGVPGTPKSNEKIMKVTAPPAPLTREVITAYASYVETQRQAGAKHLPLDDWFAAQGAVPPAPPKQPAGEGQAGAEATPHIDAPGGSQPTEPDEPDEPYLIHEHQDSTS